MVSSMRRVIQQPLNCRCRKIDTYVGRTKSTSVALDKVMHFEIYNDALSVAREGKEHPDFYLMSNPKYAAFLLNWVLA